MATIVADDALADSAGAPIDVDILEIKLTACCLHFCEMRKLWSLNEYKEEGSDEVNVILEPPVKNVTTCNKELHSRLVMLYYIKTQIGPKSTQFL
jgi:hypothetical protein